MESQLQTRALSDALRLADDVLCSRGTSFNNSRGRDTLSRAFADEPHSRFFYSAAFLACDFTAAQAVIASVAPTLAAQLKPPENANEFTVVGNCSLNLQFEADPNGAVSINIRLRNGAVAEGARVTAKFARVYSNGIVELPTTTASERVYFYAPAEAPELAPADLAFKVFAERGLAESNGVQLYFPIGRTSRVPENAWVASLQSKCGLYYVGNHLCCGEAIVNHNGFFAQDTQVVQIQYRCGVSNRRVVCIDGPFLVFFATDSGVHAAAWFDWDSMSVLPETATVSTIPGQLVFSDRLSPPLVAQEPHQETVSVALDKSGGFTNSGPKGRRPWWRFW
jgi:hypothetical protein